MQINKNKTFKSKCGYLKEVTYEEIFKNTRQSGFNS